MTGRFDIATRTLLVVLVGLSAGGSALADATDPAQIRDDAALRQELTNQCRAVDAALAESGRLKQELDDAVKAYRQQFERRQPVADRLSTPIRQIVQIDLYNLLLAMPAELDRQIKTLGEYREFLAKEIERGRIPRPFTPESYRAHLVEVEAYLGRADRIRAILKQRLPTLRPPPFIPQNVSVADHRLELVKAKEQIEAELRPLDDELHTRESRVRDLMAREDHQDRIARQGLSRFYQLLFAAHQRFRPPHLAEVKLYATHDPRRDERLYYHAIIEEPAELAAIDAKIDRLIEHLPTFQAQVDDAYRLFNAAERKFVETSDRWQEKNDQYGSLLYKEYALNGVLELADAAIGIAADGGTPASFLFEGVWRVGELAMWVGDVGENKFRLAEPRLSDELLAYRQRISQQLTPGPDNEGGLLPGGADALVARAERQLRERRLFESLAASADQHLSDQAAEAIKGGIGVATEPALEWISNKAGKKVVSKSFLKRTTFGELLEFFAEDAIKQSQRLSHRRVLESIFLSALTPDITRERAAQLLAGPMMQKKLPAVQKFLKDAAPTRTDRMLQQLKDPATYGNIVKGFAVGAFVTAEKQAIKDSIGYADQRGQLMAEMALLDIEWFGRRAEYAAAGQFHRQMLHLQAEHRALIGQLFVERGQIEERTLKVLVNKPFATLDQIDVELRFSGPLARVDVRIGQDTRHLDVDQHHVARFRTGSAPLAAGEMAMTVTARPPAGSRRVLFDADPQSVARYGGPTPGDEARDRDLWSGADGGGDTLHRFKVEPPSLKLIDDGGPGYVAGDWAGVEYHLPGALSFQDLRLTMTPMSAPVEVDIARGVTDGRMQFRVTGMGAAKLMLIGGPRNDPSKAVLVVETPIAVGLPVGRDVARGPFSRATQYDLPTRGQWFGNSARPIAEGHGRLTFERRDAASQLIGAHVTVTVDGAKQPVWAGWHDMVDLPPNTYTVVADYGPGIVKEKVQVEAGKVTPVAFGGYGRLEFAPTDGIGKPRSTHITVLPHDKDRPIWAGWDTAKDLPPGKYRVIFDYVVDIEQRDVVVTAGKITRVDAGGYGRFQLTSFDGLSQPASHHRTIYLKGQKQPVYAGWESVIDLPPDDYTIVFDYVQDIVREDQRLEAGKVKTVEASGYGRVVLASNDGLGKPVGTHRTIFYEDEKNATYGGWDGQVDLKPGRYRVVFDMAVDQEFAFEVAAGRSGSVNTTAVGRLTFSAVNGEGKPVGVHKTVYLRGSDQPVWSGWSEYLDLPPNQWEVRWRVGDQEMKATAAVQANQSASVAMRMP